MELVAGIIAYGLIIAVTWFQLRGKGQKLADANRNPKHAGDCRSSRRKSSPPTFAT